MIKIDKLSWGKVKIDNQTYHQALLIGDQVIPRDAEKLNKLFGTTHRIGDWESQALLSGKPEIVIVASGRDGVLKVAEDFKKACRANKVKLRIFKSQRAVKEYNRLAGEGKKVNALIHTTC